MSVCCVSFKVRQAWECFNSCVKPAKVSKGFPGMDPINSQWVRTSPKGLAPVDMDMDHGLNQLSTSQVTLLSDKCWLQEKIMLTVSQNLTAEYVSVWLTHKLRKQRFFIFSMAELNHFKKLVPSTDLDFLLEDNVHSSVRDSCYNCTLPQHWVRCGWCVIKIHHTTTPPHHLTTWQLWQCLTCLWRSAGQDAETEFCYWTNQMMVN